MLSGQITQTRAHKLVASTPTVDLIEHTADGKGRAMSIALVQPEPDEPWYTARQLAETFPPLGRLDDLALHRLTTLAAGIARSLGITPRSVEQPHHRYQAVRVSAYPLPVWVEAHGKIAAPVGLEPKPTVFNGTLYRSRLEARTAVWLTSMGWFFEYEPTWDEHPSGRYLPDFRVMFEDEWTWLEVKHQRELPRGRDHRWSERVRSSGYDMIVSYGLWRPVPFKDSGPARMFRGELSGAHAVHWGEVRNLYPEGAAGEFLAQRLRRAYQDAADERFGEDDGLSFAV